MEAYKEKPIANSAKRHFEQITKRLNLISKKTRTVLEYMGSCARVLWVRIKVIMGIYKHPADEFIDLFFNPSKITKEQREKLRRHYEERNML